MSKCECCQSKEDKLELNKFKCPECGKEGDVVSLRTVKNLVKNSEIIDDEKKYYICKTENCNVVYYSSGSKISQENVKVPVRFKKDANPKILCYCANVTEEDVKQAVGKFGKQDLDKVLAYTNAMSKHNCEMENPTGKCCLGSIKAFIKKL